MIYGQIDIPSDAGIDSSDRCHDDPEDNSDDDVKYSISEFDPNKYQRNSKMITSKGMGMSASKTHYNRKNQNYHQQLNKLKK